MTLLDFAKKQILGAAMNATQIAAQSAGTRAGAQVAPRGRTFAAPPAANRGSCCTTRRR